jgi:predicted peroxiredoxin
MSLELYHAYFLEVVDMQVVGDVKAKKEADKAWFASHNVYDPEVSYFFATSKKSGADIRACRTSMKVARPKSWSFAREASHRSEICRVI